MTPAEIIKKYLVEAPEQSDWSLEDHCECLAGGILTALKSRGYVVVGAAPEDGEW